MLAEDWGISADAWSATSWATMRTDALHCERWNRLHPGASDAERRTPHVTRALGEGTDPVVAVTDYMRAVPDQVSRWVRRPFTSLGTDGFGRSDARAALRRYFEVDAPHVVVAALSSLADQGALDRKVVGDAVGRYGIAADAAAPFSS